jgi:hypothetical protein
MTTTEGREASLKALAASSRLFTNPCWPASGIRMGEEELVLGLCTVEDTTMPVDAEGEADEDDTGEEDEDGTVDPGRMSNGDEDDEAGAEKFARTPNRADSTL